MSGSVLALLKASHPEPGGAVTLVSGLLAVAVGHDIRGTTIVVVSVAASQLAIGWHNDWMDADRDAAVGRTDKPVAAGDLSRRTVGVAALVAAAVTVPIALLANVPAGLAAALALGSALLYNWPLKATPLSVVPYAVSFAALPSFVVLAHPGSPAPPWWLAATGGLLGAGAHFANVLPDLDDDARTGVRGLPHRLGPRWSRVAAAGLLLAATLTLALGPAGPPSWFGLAAIAIAVAVLPIGWYRAARATRLGERPVAAFRAVIVVALVDVILLLASGRLI